MSWGLGDFCWIYFGGIVAGVILGGIGFAVAGNSAGHPGALADGSAFVGQFGGWLVGLVIVSRRKGRGTLRADFGLAVHLRDLWFIAVGVVLEIALVLMVAPISHLVNNQKQSVVNDLDTAHGLHLALIALFAGLIAPVCEELLFRGILLRALRRRFSTAVAVAVSALVFAAAHPALDPSWGTFAAVPALYALGAVSGAVAVRRGDLSVSIMLHIGFNLLATLGALFKK